MNTCINEYEVSSDTQTVFFLWKDVYSIDYDVVTQEHRVNSCSQHTHPRAWAKLYVPDCNGFSNDESRLLTGNTRTGLISEIN